MIQIREQALKKSLLEEYGFVANIQHSRKRRLLIAFGNMTIDHYFKEPRKLPFYNLYENQLIPPGATKFLGLGPKLCIKLSIPNHNISKSVQELRECIRRKYYFAARTLQLDEEKEDYNPKLYIQSLWKPSKKVNPTMVEKMRNEFETELEELLNICKSKFRKQGKLPSYLLNAAKTLRDDNDAMVILADKNQGFCVANTITYNK